MSGPLTINFINYSTHSYSKSGNYTGFENDAGITSISQQPSNNLDQGGITTISMDENILGDLAEGWAWIACGWTDDATNMHWGVKIYMPAQVLDMGSRPYYEVSYGSESSPNWITPVGDPSEPYTFPESVGVKITCTPTSHHTSLVVDVSVNDLD